MSTISEPEIGYHIQLDDTDNNRGPSTRYTTLLFILIAWFCVCIGVIIYDWYKYDHHLPANPNDPNPPSKSTRSTGWRYFVNICVASVILFFIAVGGFIGYSLNSEDVLISRIYWFLYITTMWTTVYVAIYKYYLEPNKRTNKDRDIVYKVARYWLIICIILLILLGCMSGGNACLFLLFFS